MNCMKPWVYWQIQTRKPLRPFMQCAQSSSLPLEVTFRGVVYSSAGGLGVTGRTVERSEEVTGSVWAYASVSLTVKTALQPPSPCLLLAFITSFTHPKAFGSISRSLPSFSLLYSAFNFLRLSSPSLAPAMTQTAPLADHQLLNMQTAALLPKPSTHSCIRETNTPSRRLPSYADLANCVLEDVYSCSWISSACLRPDCLNTPTKDF